jgi:MFS family permease
VTALPASTPRPVADPAGRPVDYRIVALVVSTSLFMQYLDTAALNTALPAMSKAFAVTPAAMTVVLTAYLLSLALFIPAGGALADRFGARRMFQLSLGLFLAGALACSVAPSIPLLVAARVVQGAGAAIMIPVGRLLVVRSSRPDELLSAMNWLMVPTIIGPMLGPLVGGVLVTAFSWRWIFLLHVPVALTGLMLSLRFIPPVAGGGAARFDWVGMALVGATLVLIVLGLQSLTRSAGPVGFGLLGAAFVPGALYLVHARRSVAPLLDLSLLRVSTFRVSMVSGSFLRLASAASSFLLPLLFQLGFGRTAAESGAITFAGVAGALLSRSIGVTLVKRFAMRTVTVAAMAAGAAAMAATALIRPDWPIAMTWGLLALAGFLQSTALIVLGAIAYVDVAPGRMAAATSFYTTVQQMTMSLGVSLGVILLTISQWASPAPAQAPLHFAHAFIVLGGVLLAGVAAATRFRSDAGESLRGRPA